MVIGRAREEDGMGLVELLAAMTVLSIALLALMTAFDSAALSLHKSAQKTTAATIANNRMELYRSLPYASVGLDADTTAALEDDTGVSYDALYSTDPLIDGATDPVTGAPVSDVVIVGCGTSPQCQPVQSIAGTDHHNYRVETFIRDLQNVNATTGISKTERVVTVVVRDADTTGQPILLQVSSAFDRGPR